MENERAVIGGNRSPFELIDKEINDLYGEAKLWLDGEPVATQEQADALNTLSGRILDAENRAEALRKEEAKPFDDGKKEVQGRYNPLINDKTGKTTLARKAIKDALRPYLQRLEDEKTAKAVAEREAANKAYMEAQEAMRNRETGNLADQESAEAKVQAAKEAERIATKAENDKAQAKGEGRAVGLRSVYTAVMIDATAAAKWIWAEKRSEFEAWIQEMADKEVRAGRHSDFGGFHVKHERL